MKIANYRYFATAKMPGSSLTAMVNRMSQQSRRWPHGASLGATTFISFLTWSSSQELDALSM
ncbi:hypothetical protein ACLB1R_20140 [Escherichia coli]